MVCVKSNIIDSLIKSDIFKAADRAAPLPPAVASFLGLAGSGLKSNRWCETAARRASRPGKKVFFKMNQLNNLTLISRLESFDQ